MKKTIEVETRIAVSMFVIAICAIGILIYVSQSYKADYIKISDMYREKGIGMGVLADKLCDDNNLGKLHNATIEYEITNGNINAIVSIYCTKMPNDPIKITYTKGTKPNVEFNRGG